jgi:uncharacterized protein (DUF1499 family)
MSMPPWYVFVMLGTSLTSVTSFCIRFCILQFIRTTGIQFRHFTMEYNISMSAVYSLMICVMLAVSISKVECYGMQKVSNDRSPYDLFQTTKKVGTVALSGTIAMTSSSESAETATNQLPACPPRSQNCIRTTWKAPSGTKDVHAIVLQLFKSYPHEGQSDVDKGGWTIVEDGSNNNMLRLEYKSGIGMFAKLFNGGKPFIDDVVVLVVDNSVVQIRSSSRIGKSDLGVNQKRLQFLATKAREMGWDVPDPKY